MGWAGCDAGRRGVGAVGCLRLRVPGRWPWSSGFRLRLPRRVGACCRRGGDARLARGAARPASAAPRTIRGGGLRHGLRWDGAPVLVDRVDPRADVPRVRPRGDRPPLRDRAGQPAVHLRVAGGFPPTGRSHLQGEGAAALVRPVARRSTPPRALPDGLLRRRGSGAWPRLAGAGLRALVGERQSGEVRGGRIGSP